MKRFEEKEMYIDEFGIVFTTYERNNKESAKLRIGVIIQKTYYIMGDKKVYAGCKHLSEEAAINYISYCLENGEIKVNA